MNKLSQVLRVGIAGLFALACLSAVAQVTRKGNAYLFRAKHVAGSKANYMLTTQAGLAGAAPNTILMPLKLAVLALHKDVADLKVTIGPITVKGQAKPIRPAMTETVQVDSLNRPVGNTQSPVGNAFPQQAIKVGQSWTAAMPIAGQGNVDAHYMFRGMKRMGRKQVAVVDVAVTAAVKGINVLGKGNMLIFASDGSVAHLQLTMDMQLPAQNGQKGGTVHTVMNMARI